MKTYQIIKIKEKRKNPQKNNNKRQGSQRFSVEWWRNY